MSWMDFECDTNPRLKALASVLDMDNAKDKLPLPAPEGAGFGRGFVKD